MRSVTVPRQSLNPEVLHAIGLVGNVVTWSGDGQQYLCYSVEGYDYYAFVSGHANEVTVDFGMTPSEYRAKGWAYLLPMGATIGEGVGFDVYVKNLVKGVSLAKV